MEIEVKGIITSARYMPMAKNPMWDETIIEVRIVGCDASKMFELVSKNRSFVRIIFEDEQICQ